MFKLFPTIALLIVAKKNKITKINNKNIEIQINLFIST